ncbi:trimeric LpxA-like protein [Halenospora varia]|nr:trimeric LpxA-like protein [Halenospora varia]
MDNRLSIKSEIPQIRLHYGPDATYPVIGDVRFRFSPASDITLYPYALNLPSSPYLTESNIELLNNTALTTDVYSFYQNINKEDSSIVRRNFEWRHSASAKVREIAADNVGEEDYSQVKTGLKLVDAGSEEVVAVYCGGKPNRNLNPKRLAGKLRVLSDEGKGGDKRLRARVCLVGLSAGPLHDLSSQELSQDFAGGAPQSAQSINLARVPYLQTSSEPSYSNPQAAAQLALSSLASRSRQRTQKEEMLAGRPYLPSDQELVLERERCGRACWRFNSSTNPNNGVLPEERACLFRDIIQPRELVFSPTQASPVLPLSRVGDNLVIKSPFICDYGYNISIGQDVEIGSGCTILDACEVKIGDRCNIGPNVSIYTTTLPIDSGRLGSKGPNLGTKVTIDPDCWIGGGVTILLGRSIGQGSTVGAGSIVTRVH